VAPVVFPAVRDDLESQPVTVDYGPRWDARCRKMTQTSDLNTKKLEIKRHAIRIITSVFI